MSSKRGFPLIMALIVGTFAISITTAFAQVDTAWVRIYNGLGNGEDIARAVAVDSCGNVYVTGWSWNGSNYDYATIKYYSNGDTAWIRTYNGPGNSDDRAYDIAVYGCDYVCITGTSGTIKYASNGSQLWFDSFIGNAIAVDDSGNIYVTGPSGTKKYGAGGWVGAWGGIDIAVDPSHNVYVAGGTSDYVTIKYHPNGDIAWVKSYDGPAHSSDRASGIAVDGSGNVYVTGYSWGIETYGDYATIKYDPDGDTLWVRRYEVGVPDSATAIAVDASGNVYVTGYSCNMLFSCSYVTIRYDTDGNRVWVRQFGGYSTTNKAYALALDSLSNVYVTGSSGVWGSGYDYATIKYDASGNWLWSQGYNGPADSTDIAYAIAVDDSLNVYVTGGSIGSGSSYDYATIKYVQTQLPSVMLSSPNGGEGWQAGHQYYITWSSQESTGYVRIDYSINSGASFDSIIVSSYPNTGQYLWTVPSRTSSSHCRVRVCDAIDLNPADTSDSNFTIWRCGDVDDDGSVNVSDVVWLISYLFVLHGQPPYWPMCRADVNGDGVINVSDVVYLINYLFVWGSPAPACPEVPF